MAKGWQGHVRWVNLYKGKTCTDRVYGQFQYEMDSYPKLYEQGNAYERATSGFKEAMNHFYPCLISLVIAG